MPMQRAIEFTVQPMAASADWAARMDRAQFRVLHTARPFGQRQFLIRHQGEHVIVLQHPAAARSQVLEAPSRAQVRILDALRRAGLISVPQAERLRQLVKRPDPGASPT